MKVIYNSNEVINTTNNYEALLNIPMINSREVIGNITLNDIGAYTQTQIDELIAGSRAIEIVSALPANLYPNTLYYVGPVSDMYDVYLVDEVRNVIQIGTTSFYEYFAGTGITIDEDNFIYVNIDNQTIIVDSEGNLHAVLDVSKIDVMRGCTDSEGGYKGLVPAPTIADRSKALAGDGTWKQAGASLDLINAIWPVGSVYLSMVDNNPGNFMKGANWTTSWTKISNSTGLAFWSTQDGGGAIDAVGTAPRIKWDKEDYTDYRFDHYFNFNTNRKNSQLSLGTVGTYGIWSGEYWRGGTGSSGYFQPRQILFYFNASGSSSIYKDDQTIIQPRAICVYAWRRTA